MITSHKYTLQAYRASDCLSQDPSTPLQHPLNNTQHSSVL